MDDAFKIAISRVHIWKTYLPLENRRHLIARFKMLGLEWCLRISFSAPDHETLLYYVVTIHQVVDGFVVERSSSPLRQSFTVGAYVSPPRAVRQHEFRLMEHEVNRSGDKLWFAGSRRDAVLESVFWRDASREVRFVCMFYDSNGRLKIDPVHPGPARGIQVCPAAPDGISTLAMDFSRLLEDNLLSDVRLECGGRTYQAHRCVLAARSEVFRAMMEGGTTVIKLPDVDTTVLEKLLKYIYSDELPDLSKEDTVIGLFKAASMYGVLSLKETCANWIEDHLTVGNCIRYLQWADSLSDELKKVVVGFIARSSIVLSSEAWFSFSREFPALSNEVYSLLRKRGIL